MDIKELHGIFLKHSLVDTDTRKIRAGSMFFALKGDRFDGNTFAADALQKGASYAIVDDELVCKDSRFILVDDVLQTLQQLANYHRTYLGIPILALTGSNGKTTTKELINVVLSKKFNVCATKGNLNNHIGVPLTLLSMTDTTEIGVVEMGANHHKEIAFLTTIAAPDFGYITNFGKAHLEGFGSLEGVIEAKSELYDYLIKEHKKVFVNTNDKVQLVKTAAADNVFFEGNITVIDVDPFVTLQCNDIEIKSNLIGRYNIDNLKAAITIGLYFKVDISAIQVAIEDYVPQNNRSQIINTKNGQTIILDAYNANPSSMKAALENFSLFNASYKMVILGDMFELGNSTANEHQNIVDKLKTYNFDEVILVGEHFYNTTSAYTKYKTVEALKAAFINLDKQQTILIKGSRGVALEKIIDVIDK